MREIKFRAWQKYHKKMVEVTNISFDDNGEINGVATFVENQAPQRISYRDDLLGRFFLRDERGMVLELMQYTGLKDVNGKDIYEGDVVRVQETMDGGRIVCLEAIASVIWNGERGCWGCDGEFEGHLADYAFGTVLNFMGNVCEVVGNIYENPDLLEAEK